MMDLILLGGIILTLVGLFFLFKKMKVSKEDLKKLKDKFKRKEKVSEELQALRDGKVLLSIDKRDYENKDAIIKSLHNVKDEDKREKLIDSIKNIDEDFKAFKPEDRFNFEKEVKREDIEKEVEYNKIFFDKKLK